MLPFLWTFGFLGFLIVCGICISLSLSLSKEFSVQGDTEGHVSIRRSSKMKRAQLMMRAGLSPIRREAELMLKLRAMPGVVCWSSWAV